MALQALETIELNLCENPEFCIIWLHGLGADGRDFEAIVPELNLPTSAKFRFIFPHAPFQPISVNGGAVMRGWFDIHTLEFNHDEDESGIHDSTQAIFQLIQQQQQSGINPDHIILAGFSQGGAIALNAGLSYPDKICGIMALSTWLPLHGEFSDTASVENQHTPIFMAHGNVDDVVKYIYGSSTRDLLQRMDYAVEWHDYNIAHGVGPEEIDDIRDWLLRVTNSAQQAS